MVPIVAPPGVYQITVVGPSVAAGATVQPVP